MEMWRTSSWVCCHQTGNPELNTGTRRTTKIQSCWKSKNLKYIFSFLSFLLLLLLPFYSLLFAFFPAYDFPVLCLRLLVQKLWPNSFQALYYRCRYFIYEVKIRRPSLGRMDECQFVPVELFFFNSWFPIM